MLGWRNRGHGRSACKNTLCNSNLLCTNLNRERSVYAKPLRFHLAPERPFGLKRRARGGVCTERQHGDRNGGRVPSKKRKAEVAVFKIILSLTGIQWSAFSSGLTCSCLPLRKTALRTSLFSVTVWSVHIFIKGDPSGEVLRARLE